MHIPVLLQEVLEYLRSERGGYFVDATAGSGGHLKAILAASARAEVLGIDLDQTGLDKLKDDLVQTGLGQRAKLVRGNYKDFENILSEAGIRKVDGILLDLGFSSLQLDDPGRGFSFQTDGRLDMRFDSGQKLTAEKVVNAYSLDELHRVIKEYGEEKFAYPIARLIVRFRQDKAIETTFQLAEIIRSAIPKPIRFKAADNIRRVFQGIRIEVNRELDNLKDFLPKSLKALNPNGRLVIISFHSLEDRIVKDFFVREAKDCVCPPEFPTCVCGKTSSLRILTRKPVTASAAEILQNPRSKSAKLRAVEIINFK